MKKILYIFFLLISVARAQSVIDSTTLKIAPARDGLFYEISDPGTVPDNITHFVFGGKHYRKLGLSNEKTTENLGIYPNGTNYRARLQGLIDSSSITKISIASIMPGQITINGDSIDFRGKTLVFKGGVQLKGSTKIKNVLIDADKRDFIIDSTIVLGENVKFLNGEISVMNLGAGPTRTAAQNASIIRKATDYAGIYKGQTILFPEGDYKIRRKDTKIIEGQKYTTYKGEGMYKTRLILDSADYFNFRRIFDLGEGDSSVTIKDFGFKMGVRGQYYDSAGVDFTEDDGDPATDYQCMPIFSYSGDSTKPVFDLRIENIFAEDLPGDVIGISRNTQYVHIKNIRFRNYMRQGISLGGGGVKDVWIEDVIDLGSTTILQVGGHSIHCEPSSLQYNINYLNCKVRDFSYSGIASGSISGIETWGNSIIYCNKISNTVITDCKINGQLQISSLPEGNINVHNNRELLDGIYVTTVSGASSSPKSIYIQNNKKIIATGKPAIWLNNMDSLVLDGNDATNSGDVTVRIANCRGTRVVNNKIKKTGTGNYEALYLYSSSSSLFGVGMDYINNNIIDGDYRGIRIGNKSAIIGPSNVVNAPTPYEISTAKIFPYRGPDGKQYLKFLGSGLPTYKDWAVGDVVENTANTPGEQRFWICDTAGAAHQGNWNPSLTYYINAYVRDSTNGRVYRSKAVNGQNELPSSDTDNTYWEQVATRTASFVGSDAYKGELWGFGVPTRTDVSTGTIYHRRDGDSCTSIYTYSATGWKASGCGGAGISADDVETIVNNKLDSLPTDSLAFDQDIINDDSLSTTVGALTIKNRLPKSPLKRSDSLFSITSAQRLYGTTVIADIIDRRTGVAATFTKRTTYNGVTIINGDNDSVMIHKIGSDFWVRNVQGDIDVNIYNVVADGSTDNTVTLQKVGTFANRFKKKLYFPAGAGVYKVTGKVTLDPSVFYSFAPGAILAADSLIGGVPDIPYWQQAFTDTTVVRPSAIAGGMVSVKWWGAKGDNSNNDQPAIQSAVNCVTYNNTKFTTVFLPAGIYKIDDPIACARYNVNKWEQVTVTLLGEGSGFSSKFAGNGTIIRKTYKDRPGVWFQIAKSGGIQSITIEGAYTVPSMSDSAFYNISLSAYTDPTCRDTKFSPDCGVAIDPLKYTGTPADGGYPGQSGLGSTWNYSAAGNATSSGSSGISFKDMKVRKNVVGFIASPNGQTQNNDASTYENIKIEDSKVGFSSCQDQEKGNVYRNIISWGTCHTLFDNLTYGVGTSGHIIVEKVNVAALNNQLVNWSTAGRFPSFWRDIYSESLGRFGTLATTSSAITVRDAVLRWVDPALAGGYLPNYHIDVTRGVTFDGCSIMNYGLFLPTIIKSTGTGETGAVFANCYFETPPVFWAVHASGTPVFKDCYYYPSNKFNPLGSIQAQFAQTKTWTVNSTYKLTDNASSFTTKTAAIKEINVDGSYLWDATATGNNIAVSPNTDRTDTVTVSNGTAPFYIAGRPIYFLDGSVFLFGGIVSGQNGNNSVYIKNMPIQMVTKTYTRIYAMNYITLHGFLGNTTSGSQYIKGVSTSGDVGVAVGQVVHSKIFGGSAVVMYVSNDTVQLTNAANATTTGTYFTPRGVTRNFINPSTATDSATFGGSQIMGAGATFESTNQQKYLVTKSGFFSAVAVGGGETRQAEWVPFNQNYSIGSGAPSGGTGLIGDMYKDTAAGREYRKTAVSTWTILPADPVLVKTLDGQSMNGPGDIDITVGKVPTGDSIKICIGGVCYTVKDSTAAYLGGGLPSYPYNYGVRTSPRGYDSTWMLVVDTVNHRIGIKGTPSYDLDVNGTFRKVGNNTARFEHSSGNNMHGIELYATGVGTAMAQWKANQSTGEVRFGAGSGGYFLAIFSNNIERARFFANGRFGYNMTTDLNVANFHINSSVAINKDSTVKQSTVGTRQMLVMDSTNGKIQRMDIPTLGTPITGTYTPSASSNTNVSSATFSSSNYVVNDKLVTVWGKVEVVLSNTANTSMLTFNLPSVGTLLTSSIRGVSNYRMGSSFLSESSGSVRIDFIKEGSPVWTDYIIEYSYSFFIQ